MSLPKVYQRINWENYPSDNTPINEQNLNKMDGSIDEIDNRVIELDVKKVEKTETLKYLNNAKFDEDTGILTITRVNGSKIIIDTKLEKIAVNFRYDKVKQQLIITADDGTEQEVDLSALVTQYEFDESDRVIFSVKLDGTIVADLKKGSITADYLEPNYLAQITVQTEIATSAASSAKASADAAKASADAAAESAKKAEEVSEVNIATAEKAGIIKPNDIMTVDADGTLNINTLVPATANEAGKKGLVPTPGAGKQAQFLRGDGVWATPTNTKNTAGATNKAGTKMFLVGATEQSSNPTTYSNLNVYVGTDNELYSNDKKVANAEDISKLNENLDSKVDNDIFVAENLLPYPYDINDGDTFSGVTATINTDGSITLNGTATSEMGIRLLNISRKRVWKAGTYTLSRGASNASVSLYDTDGKRVAWTKTTLTFTLETDTIADFRINTVKGATYDNVTIYPMVEVGSIVHEYQPSRLSRENLSENLNDFFYKAGDEMNLNQIMCAGCISTNTTTALYTIPLPKPMVANSAEIYDTKISCRHLGGYVYINDDTNLIPMHNMTQATLKNYCNITYFYGEGNVTVSCELKTGKFVDSTGTVVTNNIPIVFHVTSGKLLFS